MPTPEDKIALHVTHGEQCVKEAREQKKKLMITLGMENLNLLESLLDAYEAGYRAGWRESASCWRLHNS